MSNPTVSVIIPTHNRAHLITKAIKSVLNQTYQEFELIVVDDASTDNTEEVVKSFSDNRIRYIPQKTNLGGSAARNTGIKAAKGEYIGFLDDDDEWLTEKLQKQINKFQKLPDDFGLVYTGQVVVSEKRRESLYSLIPKLRGNVYNNLLGSCILGSATPIVKKRCFKKAGFFDETLPSCQDWDMWIRISKYYKFDYVPNILAKQYSHGNQISLTLEKKIIGREKLLKKHWFEISHRPQTYANLLNRLGVLQTIAGNSKKARKYFFDSFRVNPFRRGSYMHFLLSVLSPQIHRTIVKKRYCNYRFKSL
jgi:glycosyltransferase involved in cell wall biosynthesis